MRRLRFPALVAGLVLAGAAPLIVPSYATEMGLFWVMVVFALTWDVLGGQAGYNSFGNVLFFGLGAYGCAVVQRDSGLTYYTGFAAGMATGMAVAVLAALVLGRLILKLRGHYFAVGTLGLGVAAAELFSGWDYVGAGAGMTTPVFPGAIGYRDLFFYYLFLILALVCLAFLAWLYSTRFGLALNAIRDDEDKAEAMGLHTARCKTAGWAVAAFFLGLTGGGVANLTGFIDARETAFSSSTYGVWMVLMAILGGKGTLWGPVLGAAVFHVTQELFWKYLLGWQRVALGLLIVAIVVFFPQGILGWFRQHRTATTAERST